MRRIFKYPLVITDVQSIAINQGAKFLHVDSQNGPLYLWALVDDANPLVKAEILIVGTGNSFPDAVQWPHHIGTVIMHRDALLPSLVWHVFSRTRFAE